MRKLVSIQKIDSLNPIPNADAIEVAKVLGWSVVVKKGEFKVGDKVIYAEIDSLFPDKPEFNFLSHSNFRIRTVRLRGQISQGICFQMNLLPEGEYEIGTEVTELLGVKQYEIPVPACLDGLVKGGFPVFIQATYETRVQNLQQELNEHAGEECVITEKLDGVSTTFHLFNNAFGVSCRNLELLEDDKDIYWNMARKYDIEEKLRRLGRNLGFQGETIGSAISKNKYKLPQNERKFYLFNIFDIDKYEYLHHDEVMRIAKELELPTVPVLDDSYILSNNIDELVELSKGKTTLAKDVRREGVVIKIKNPKDHGFSFKSINPEFLLKYGDE